MNVRVRWLKTLDAGILAVCGVALLAAPASANIGLPMVFIVVPASWVLLLAVIPLEAVIGVKLAGVALGTAMRLSAVANLVSTVVGVPLTWGALVLVEMLGAGGAEGLETLAGKIFAVTIQSPWLVPYEGDLHWMVPAAAMTLCVPFCLMSIWVEKMIVRRAVGADTAGRWVPVANLVSYGLIEMVLLVTLLIQLRK